MVGPRPIQQANPLIVSAGASAAGCEFAAHYASVAFIPGRTGEEFIADRRQRLETAAKRVGREDAESLIASDATQIADQIETLQKDPAFDGLSLSFPFLGGEQIERLADSVSPLLRDRGVWSPAAARHWAW